MAKRYQRCNQKMSTEELTIQQPKDINVVIRSRQHKNQQYNGQKTPTWYSDAVNRRTNNTMGKRQRRFNQKPSSEDLTIQWPKGKRQKDTQ